MILWAPISPLSSSVAALVFTAVLATIVIGFLPPFWDTNDDVGMAMILDGYGLAAYPSPGIVFSNILFGYAVAKLPLLGDISRYALASVSLNIIAIFLICRALCLLNRNYLLALSITTLISLVPFTFPQFTILAGMLSIAGILHLALYLERGQARDLLIAGLALFAAYLVRSHEFYLVFLISLVFLPWRQRLGDRRLRIFAVILLGLAVATAFADWRYYQAPEWQAFNEVNLLRVPFTDLGVAKYFLEHLELLRDTEYSPNDVTLLAEWFFVDPNILNPQGLSTLLARVNLQAFLGFTFKNLAAGVGTIFNKPLIYLLLPAVAVGIATKNRTRIGLAWLVLIVAIAVLSSIGRPPPIRVLYPPIALLLCLGAVQIALPFLRWTVIGVIGVVGIPTIAYLIGRHNYHVENHFIARTDLATIDKSNLHVVWGADLHLESMYPVFGSMAEAREFRWYGLGVTSLAPFAMAHWKEMPGGLVTRLISRRPIAFFASQDRIDHLSIYCKERYSRELQIISTQKLRIGTIFTVTCY
jgi:MFS family permease